MSIILSTRLIQSNQCHCEEIMRELPLPVLMALRPETSFAYYFSNEWKRLLMATDARKTYVGDGQVIIKNGCILYFAEEVCYSVRTLIRDNRGVFFWSYDIVSKHFMNS
jgi:hypothetical protein